MSRVAYGVVAAMVLLAGLFGAGLGPAVGQPVTNETTVDCTYPITVSDATGADVTVSEEPQRVVVLAPSAAQVMWEIGAEEKIVGMPVKFYTQYLNGSTEKTNVVGEQGTPQVETIIGLEPDLVLAPNIISQDAVEQLRGANVTVYRFESATSIEDVVEKTRLTGRLVGAYDTAQQVSARTAATLSAYQRATANEERPTVYYAMGGGYTAGTETFVGDVIHAAGGQNIASAANISTYKPISTEVVVEQNPDWIVLPRGAPAPSGPAINETTAIQQDQILRVDANSISQPGPRVTQPLETIAAALHPNAAGNVSVDPSTVSAPICAADVSTTPVTTTSGPGVGAIGALVAIFGAEFLRKQR